MKLSSLSTLSYCKRFLRCCTTHWVNGSPVYPGEQVHMGVWDTMLQTAFMPQDPGQGSLHLWLMHAKLLGHSLLLIHSGLQLGGEPVNSGRQEHDGESLITWHWAFGPHGDGSHGFCCGGTSNAKIQFKCNLNALNALPIRNNDYSYVFRYI